MKETFLDRMNAKLQASGIKGRQDLELHDAKVLEKDRAVRVLATYSPLYGPPSIYDTQHWLSSKMGEFGQFVALRPDTVAVYPENNTVTFVVEQKVTRQPLAAASGMVKAGVDQYLDGQNVLWEVVKAEQGPSYIVRKDGVSVERMLEIRRQALRGGVSGRKHVTLASLDTIPTAGGGFATVDVGDTVDFYNAGLIHRGKVGSAGANGVKISVGGDTYTVDPQAITNVVEKSASAQTEQDDAMRRYFSLIYPGNPKMTEMISPTSNKPVNDPRPMKVEPIEVVASAGATPRPTQRVLGQAPGARSVQPSVVSARVPAKR
jgi:hypothetical protein